jgi:hypothetical protein
MKTSRFGIWVVSSTWGWCATACGSDTATTPSAEIRTAGGGGGATGSAATAARAGAGSIASGVDPTKPVNQLTLPEADQLCQTMAPPALEVANDPEKSRGSCVLRIIQTQFYRALTTVEECEQQIASCDAATAPSAPANLPAAVPSLLAAGMACASGTLDINPTCRANIGEVEGCLSAGLGALGVANRANCTTIMSGAAAREVAQTLGNSGVLACQGYQSKCSEGFTLGSAGAPGAGGSSSQAGVAGAIGEAAAAGAGH